MINLPPTNAGYADGADLDEWTPWDSDEFICLLIERCQVPALDVPGVQEVMKGRA